MLRRYAAWRARSCAATQRVPSRARCGHGTAGEGQEALTLGHFDQCCGRPARRGADLRLALAGGAAVLFPQAWLQAPGLAPRERRAHQQAAGPCELGGDADFFSCKPLRETKRSGI